MKNNDIDLDLILIKIIFALLFLLMASIEGDTLVGYFLLMIAGMASVSSLLDCYRI